MIRTRLGDLGSPARKQPSSRKNEMARTMIEEKDWDVFVKVAEQLGIDLPGLMQKDVRFLEMEDAGHQLGRAIAQATTERLSLARAQRLTGDQPCPTCGKSCPLDFKERELVTGDGPIELPEPVCHCSVCRRDFFPSPCGLGT